MSVFLLATLDTKGIEAQYLRARLEASGLAVTLVDVGTQGPPLTEPDIDRTAILKAAGSEAPQSWSELGRGDAVTMAARGVAEIVAQRMEAGEVEAVLAIGGSAGTTIGTAAMKRLPLSLPKVVVSTMASGDVRPYVGDRNIVMINAVVDIAGLNRISRIVLSQAADCVIGMLKGARRDALLQHDREDREIIAATMFGVTTPCVQQARQVLEAAGYEVLVFHATGSGGRAMETLIGEGLIAGVLDLTTTELADELVGGVLSAGPDRLQAAGAAGIPQVVSVGALDMVNFGPRETVPPRFADRKFHIHNPTVTLMRTNADECLRLGETLARKVGTAQGPAAILFPSLGVSAIDAKGQAFDDPAARESLWSGLTSVESPIKPERFELHINDPRFATTAARRLIDMMHHRQSPEGSARQRGSSSASP